MRHRVVSDFRLAGFVCHGLCLLVLVADRFPTANTAVAQVADISSLVASHENRPQLDEAASSSSSSFSRAAVAAAKTRSIRAAVLPLGHRYIGLGKRLLLASSQRGAGVGGGSHDKRPYSHQDGAAMRFIGLGKRGGGTRVVDSGLRFIGLGKRNAAAMRYIGLGKRPSFYDNDTEEEELQDMEGKEEDEENEEEPGEDYQEDRRSRVIAKRSTDGRRHQVKAEKYLQP